MKFLKTILNDLDKLNIPHEEHYDPGGMRLHVLYIREEANPTLIYSRYNPHQILLSIFIIHSPPHLAELEVREKYHLELCLKELGLQIGLLHKIGIQKNIFHASVGIVVDAREYNQNQLKVGMKDVMEAYDNFIERAFNILYR